MFGMQNILHKNVLFYLLYVLLNNSKLIHLRAAVTSSTEKKDYSFHMIWLYGISLQPANTLFLGKTEH